MCLKWEIEMMTSKLRAAVRREMEYRRISISRVSRCGGSGLLQEVLGSLGKQSSAPSSSITTERRRREAAELWQLSD